jgi:hypothetical protein
MDISTDKKNLAGLVEKAQSGEVVLPEFQRDFVWDKDSITDLLLSILKGYYIGSFLFLRVDRENRPFEIRPIAGLNRRNEELRPDWMVLDGQQRLTSLHYVFTAPAINLKHTKHPYRFYLELRKLEENKVDESIWSERADYYEKYDYETYQFENKVIPFSRIPQWETWKQRYAQWLNKQKQNEELARFIGEVEPIWTKGIENIRHHMIPVIEIPKVPSDDEEAIAEVCAIFEKLNSTGVLLSVYDLLTARLFRYKIDLHKLWERTTSEYRLISEFSEGDPDVYGILILRCVALLRGLDVKGKNIVNLRPEKFEEDWAIASLYFEKALERISSTSLDGFGAFDTNWMPYSTMVPVLAALLLNADTRKREAPAYDLVKKWYWCSVFLERYGGSVESTTYRDYADLVTLFDNPSNHAEVFDQATNQIVRNPSYSLDGIASRRSGTYKGVMNLIALAGAKDFVKCDSIEFHQLDDHHIFPRSYLKKLRNPNGEATYDEAMTNVIANKTLISSDTNRKISGSKPSAYVSSLIRGKKDDVMKSHLISETALKFLKEDDYKDFLKERENTIIAVIRERCK